MSRPRKHTVLGCRSGRWLESEGKVSKLMSLWFLLAFHKLECNGHAPAYPRVSHLSDIPIFHKLVSTVPGPMTLRGTVWI